MFIEIRMEVIEVVTASRRTNFYVFKIGLATEFKHYVFRAWSES